jgi:hypothetical protein
MRTRPVWLAAAATASVLIASVVTSHPAGAAPTFASPVVVTSDNLGEPSIDVSTNGNLFINAPSGISSPSPIFRSTNGGTSWTKLAAGTRGALPGGGDSDIAIDQGDGTIYFSDLWLGNMTAAVSHDQGSTWTAQPLGGPPVQDRQWNATPGGGRAYLVTHQIPTGLVVSQSVDGGVTYPIQTVAATPADQTGCICPPGTMIAEGSALLGDKVGVIYATSVGGINFARSTNGAASFTQTSVSPASSADNTTAFPVVANAGGNKLVATWLEVIGSTSRIMYNSSTNWGQTWGTPKVLVSGGASVYPWIDVRGTKVAVSLYHSSTSGTADTVGESAQWFEQYLESTDGGATFSAPVTVDATVVKTGPICTGGTGCSSDRELLDFQAVAIDRSGLADLTWTRSIDGNNNTELRFIHQTA